MMKYLLFGISILITKSVYYTNSDEKCQCDAIINQFDCMLNSKCFWNSTQCAQLNCSQIHYQSQCYQTKGCYYSDNKCQYLDNCSQIKATNVSECQQQSYYCGSFNETNSTCAPYGSQPCSTYNNSMDCQYDVISQCLWIKPTDTTNGSCSNFACSLLDNQEQCNVYSLYCQWSDKQNCTTTSCDTRSTSQCSAVFINNNLQTSIQPCFVDTTQNPAKCRDANLDDLGPTTCGINTNFYATWSTPDSINGNGYCKSCFESIITIISIALLFILQ